MKEKSRLYKLRKEKMGYTQIQMQMKVGIDQSQYSKLENGKEHLTFEQCKRLALVLGTSMDYLAELTDKEEPYPRNKETKELIKNTLK